MEILNAQHLGSHAGPYNHTFINDCTALCSAKARVHEDNAERSGMDDDILEQYRREAAAAMEVEAKARIAEITDVEHDEILRNTSLTEIDDLVPALLARLGQVRAALDGHGGGISVTDSQQKDDGLYLVLDLTGACLSCGAAPGTLEGVKNDLESDDEIVKVDFCSSLLDTFDELGREFILAHGKVDFV